MLKISNFQFFFSITLLSLFFFKQLLGDTAFITNQESNKVDIIDLELKKKKFEIDVGRKPAGITIDKKNNIIFISNPGSNNISKINYEKLSQEFIFGGKSPMSLQYSSFQNFLYVSNW